MRKILFFLLLTFSLPAFSGCFYQGNCLANGAALLNNFLASYPQNSSGFVYQHSMGNVPTVTDACVISNFQLTKIDLINGVITSGISQVYRMDACNYVSGWH